MIRRGNLIKNTAIALAIISVFGSTLSSVSAAQIVNSTQITQNLSENSEVVLKTTLKHATKDQESSAHKYLVSSKLKLVNGKTYMSITLDNSDDMFIELKGNVNGNDVETKTTTDDNKKEKTMEFEINSLDDDIVISFTYDTGMPGIFPPDGLHTSECRVISEIASTDDDTVTPPTDDTTTPPKDEDDAVTSPTPDVEESEYKDGNYTINVTTESQMAKQFLGDVAHIKIENGKIYATFNMTGASLMSDLSIKVDGESVEFTEYEKNGDNVKFTVEVPNLDSKITLSMYVEAMGRNVEFEATLDKDTLKENTTSSDSNDNGSSNNNSNSNSNNNNGSTSGDTNTSTDNNVSQGTTVKEYTIQNEVIYDNEVGYNMVRQYLNKTTKIEEVNGKMYATLTFTGVDLMNNHKVYVNGALVNHTVTSKTSDSISIRFEISDINDEIQVELFVVPMSKTVKFGVELLEDTLTFVKEYTVDSEADLEGSADEESTTEDTETLPQTGSAFGNEMLLGFGGILTATGALLRRKRK